MQAIADAMASQPPLWSLDPAAARAAIDAMEGLDQGGPTIDREFAAQAPAAHGAVPLTIVAPADPIGVLLYFHGGGWVLGNARQMLPVARHLAEASGCAVVLVDYRLAPEHPYPAALEDAEAALEWCVREGGTAFGAALPLAVGGDSAGGNLATVLALRAAGRGPTPFRAQYLAYPVTDADFETESYCRFADGPVLDRETMKWFWAHYAGDYDRADPALSPLRHADLSALPPAIVVTAGIDPLRSEAIAYADALERAGVAVVRRDYPDMAHGFTTMPTLIDAGVDALRFAGGELRRILGA